MSTTTATPTEPVRFEVEAADGTRLRVWSNRALRIDAPVVLLCNGLGTNPYAWPGLLSPDSQVHVVSWDHRGVGGSDRPADRDRVTVEDFVDDALAVLDHLGIESCVVAGWSMGVNAAFELAVQHPDRVRGLFAVAGVPGDTFSTMLAPLRVPPPIARVATVGCATAMLAGGRLLTRVTTRLPWNPVTTYALRHSGFMLPSAASDDVSRAVAEFLRVDVDWYMHLAIQASKHGRVSLSQVRVPTTFVAGRWDVLAGAYAMRSAAERIDDARYVELDGSHFLPLEHPQPLHDELAALVRRAYDLPR